MDSATIAALAGTYALSLRGESVPFTMTADGGKLYIDLPPAGLTRAELLADSDSTLFARSTGLDFAVERNRAGRVVGLTVDGLFKTTKVQ